jgi:hypothetical protein
MYQKNIYECVENFKRCRDILLNYSAVILYYMTYSDCRELLIEQNYNADCRL